jgi:sugar phosphate isomerase/epimerase
MRLACSTASFPRDRLQTAIAKVQWAGYMAVELHLPLSELPGEEDVRRFILANELELAAVHAGVAPATADAAGMEELVRLGRAAAFTRALDGSIIVVQAPETGSLTGLAGALRTLDRALGSLSADVCLVNRRATVLETPQDLGELWSAGLPSRVGIALDPAHAHLTGWSPTALDDLPELPRHLYLNNARDGSVVPPGEGELDLAGLGYALRARGYGGSVAVVLENADAWAVEPIAMETRQAAETWFELAG